MVKDPEAAQFVRHKVSPLPEAASRPHEARANLALERRVAAGRAPHKVVVAIPVRNEVESIAACLRALNDQEGASIDRVVLLLNNCNDGTVDCIRRLRPQLHVGIDAVARDFRGNRASAGFARSLAVRHAMETLDAHDVLLTTDADAVVASDWIAANLASLHEGADAVCGRAVLNPADAASIPAHLHEDDARELKLSTLLDEMAWLMEPDPYDPWPRHTEHSGASLAATVSTWRRAGGIPAVAHAEDRAFVARLRQIDARVRHAPEVRVTVSGRTLGRATGGMADTIRRRIIQQDEFADSDVEPASNRHRRLELRNLTRTAWQTRGEHRDALIDVLQLPPKIVRAALASPFFGQAWSSLERVSPLLRPVPVRFADLHLEIAQAELILETIRNAVAAGARQSELAPV
jgi:GT2 family glycosyltransferase